MSLWLLGQSDVFKGPPQWLSSKQSTCNAGDVGSIPGWERSPGKGNGNPLQYSCLENPYGQRSLEGCSLWGHKEPGHGWRGLARRNAATWPCGSPVTWELGLVSSPRSWCRQSFRKSEGPGFGP